MIYMLDTANAEDIKRLFDLYPISGVTTNPTLVSKEKKEFFPLLKEIRDIIGDDTMLHVQTLGKKSEDIIKEAYHLKETISGNLYIKIPVVPEGIKAMKHLSTKGFKITATAIFTPQQALLAATAGAEYLAPYINRLDNICSSASTVVSDIVRLLEVSGNTHAKVLGASFKNVNQVHETMLSGSQSVTLNAEITAQLLTHPMSAQGIAGFENDWADVYGKGTLVTEL